MVVKGPTSRAGAPAERRPTASPAIFGLVLAGGASRRMGADKASLELAGRSLLARAVEALAPQVRAVAVNIDPADPAAAAVRPLPCLADALPGRIGPLAGLLAGLGWAQAAGATRLQVVPVDAPFLPDDLVARLAAAPAGTIAVARSGGRIHPVFALVPVSLGADLAAFLAAGENRAVMAWLDRHEPVAVDFPPRWVAGRAVDPFLNLNTPADLAAAEAILAAAEPPAEGS
jgi:molybdopterin-guanine dinucleotide biosynthesis protein A